MKKILFLLFLILINCDYVFAQQTINIIGNKFTIYDKVNINTLPSVNPANFILTPVPQNSRLILEIKNNTGATAHTISATINGSIDSLIDSRIQGNTPAQLLAFVPCFVTIGFSVFDNNSTLYSTQCATSLTTGANPLYLWTNKLPFSFLSLSLGPWGTLNGDSISVKGYFIQDSLTSYDSLGRNLTSVLSVTTDGTQNLIAPTYCPVSVTSSSIITAATTQLIAALSTFKIRICSVTFANASVTATNAQLVAGTGTNCGTGQHTVLANLPLGANTLSSSIEHLTFPGTLNTNNSEALCVTTSAAGSLQVTIVFAQY